MSMPHTQTSKDIKYNAHKQMSGPTSTKSARAEPHEYAAYTNVGSNTETKARQGRARHGKTRQGKARQDNTRHGNGKARQDKAWQDKTGRADGRWKMEDGMEEGRRRREEGTLTRNSGRGNRASSVASWSSPSLQGGTREAPRRHQ